MTAESRPGVEPRSPSLAGVDGDDPAAPRLAGAAAPPLVEGRVNGRAVPAAPASPAGAAADPTQPPGAALAAPPPTAAPPATAPPAAEPPAAPTAAPALPSAAEPAGHPPGQPGAAGQPAGPAAAPKGHPRRLLLLIPILLIVGGVAAFAGYRFWYESTFFVSTENAQVTGDLVQFGSLNAGRVVAIRTDVGQTVERDQEVGVVSIPQPVGSTPIGDTPRYEQTGTDDTRVSVKAPISGVVAARMASVGSTVTAGQAMFAVVDPTRIWINANIEEGKVARVQPGQPVEVHADALNRDFAGRVVSVTPASAATFSLLPQSNASGNFTKVTQYVPVKIAVDSGDQILPLGTNVEVKIRVGNAGGLLP